MDDIIIYPSKLKLVGLTIMGVGMLALCSFLGLAQGVPVGMAIFLWVIGVPFFGVCLGYSVYRLCVPQPLLVVNQEGINDTASAIGVGMLRWEEIARLEAYTFMNQRMLGITPVDLAAVLARQPAFKRYTLRANANLAIAPINIPQNALPMSVDALLEKIEAFRVARITTTVPADR